MGSRCWQKTCSVRRSCTAAERTSPDEGTRFVEWYGNSLMVPWRYPHPGKLMHSAATISSVDSVARSSCMPAWLLQQTMH